MITTRSLTRVLTQRVKQQVYSKRTHYPYDYRHAITAPRVRIPFPEKVFWGLFMGLTIFSVPAWVMVHHREYMGKTEEEE